MITLTTIIIILVVAFAFFAQSLMGFGGGLIAIPILSIFMPVQDVVAMVMIYQLSMGLLAYNIRTEIKWKPVLTMVPSMLIGVALGVALLNILHGDIMRIILASYIVLHLLRKRTNFDPLGYLIQWGDAYLAGFLGGTLNAMIGGGGPAFILYLKDKVLDPPAFRASITIILFLSNIPRVFGFMGTGLLTHELFLTGLMAYPGFLIALIMGQKLHNKIPTDKFFIAVEVLLACSAALLILKIIF